MVLTRCKNYTLQIRSSSQTCGDVFSDVSYLPASDSCCSRPVITNLVYNYDNSTLDVTYLTKPYNEGCTLKAYDENNNEIINQQVDCSGSSISLNEIDPCEKLRFQITSYSALCDSLISDTAYYDGCCAKPVIKGFTYLYQEEALRISYVPHPNYNQCSLLGYDANNNQIIDQQLTCTDSSVEITGISPGLNYHFKILSSSQNCSVLYSDMAYYQGSTCLALKPVIHNVSYNKPAKVIDIAYSIPHSNINAIQVYDDNNSQIFSRILNNTDTLTHLTGLFPCQNYRFVLGNTSDNCGTVYSDTTYYNATDSCCSSQITRIHYNFSDSTMAVNYVPRPESDGCSIRVFDTTNTEISTQEIDCTGSTSILSGLDPAQKYGFQIVSHSLQCDSLFSDTVYYDGSCSKPAITGISYFGDVRLGDVTVQIMQLNFIPHFNFDNCTLFGYDENDTQIFTKTIDCGASAELVSSFDYIGLDPCLNYHFLIVSHSQTCNDVYSDTAYYNGVDNCNHQPRITDIQYNYGDTVMHVSYRPLPSSQSCALIVLDENNTQIINQQIGCNDTFTDVANLNPNQDYYFQIIANFGTGDELFSNTGYYYGYHPSDTCMVYIPISLSEPVVIPPILSCGYQKPCITCDTLQQFLLEFKSIYPGFAAVPYMDSTATEEQLKQNRLLARFLNYRTGFSKNASEYILAFENCQNTTGDIYALCDFVKPLNDASEYVHADTTPCQGVQTQALYIAQVLYENVKDSLTANFNSLYLSKCLSARNNEVFYAKYLPGEYHYTLYFYDQAGNLVQTLPPAAVKPYFNPTYLDDVQAARDAGSDLRNENNNWLLATQYRYNTLNQVIVQISPDGGLSKFWYDRLGRLVVSQNAKQFSSDFSYTRYDALGRINEVGEKHNADAMSQLTSQDTTALQTWMDNSGTNTQLTRTVYDIMNDAFCDNGSTENILCQKNLRNRVSYTYTKAIDDPSYLWDAATFYSYDIHGNVDTLLQDYNTGMGAVECTNSNDSSGNRFKKIVYQYDLISGKVNTVAYQQGWPDAFYHRYNYDAENRLTSVETSKDKIYWENDATYEYYRHGPLSRIQLGQNRVQGLDYAYTIQGWLKGVNSSALHEGGFDMGNDGQLDSANKLVARDAYGFSLNYFKGDYKPISADVSPFTPIPMTLPADPATSIATGSQLYNGNIASMLVNIPKVGESKVYGYRYDQLNRIIGMDAFNGLNNATNEFTPVRIDDYHEKVSYDPNGNIRSYLRNGTNTNLPAGVTGGIAMDSLNYEYIANTNKLKKVSDKTAYTSNYPDDIDNQTDGENYVYDSIGNLIRDNAEGISIEWNVYGKISHITKDDGTNIYYTYDAGGNRISKTVNNKTTYYVRDASGNVMSVYENDVTAGNEIPLTQTELHLYGSNRLGIYNVHVNVQDCEAAPDIITTFIRGNKFFELSNHLGNILTTISDKKLGHDRSEGSVDYFNAEVVTANDYYPGGMDMPGRKYSIANTNYRYGFNGKEKDDKDGVVQYDYGFRIYDPRLVRFKSADPLAKDYPFYTPYQFAGNTPIQAIDVDGLEPASVVKQNISYTKVTIYPTEDDPNPKIQTLQVRVVTYKFTELATHLLSIVSGISESDIRKVNIQNGAGTLMPAYPVKYGGGAMTFPGNNSDYNINFTDNFFSHDGSEMGYGQDDFSQNINEWLDLSSHEVGHIRDIQEIGGGQLRYFSTFLKDYIKAGSHDDNPREQRADYGQKVFDRFTTFTNKKYGDGAIVNLFDKKDVKEDDKIKTLEEWSKAFSASEEERIFPNSTDNSTNNSTSNTSNKKQK